MVIIVFLSRLLKDKRVSDESFNRFLELKRGAAMHTLESLMLLPVSPHVLSLSHPRTLSLLSPLSPPLSLSRVLFVCLTLCTEVQLKLGFLFMYWVQCGVAVHSCSSMAPPSLSKPRLQLSYWSPPLLF